MMRTLSIIIVLTVNTSSFSWNSNHPKKTQQELKDGGDRRAFLQRTIFIANTATTAGLAFPTQASQAIVEGEQRMQLNQKPKAPMGALIPVAQQRLLLEQCLGLSSRLLKEKEQQEEDDENIQKLQSILLPLQDDEMMTTASKNKLFRQISSSNNNIKDLSVMLQYQPNKNLSGSLVRAAMNVYTANLQYGGDEAQYTVTDPDWKKSYI